MDENRRSQLTCIMCRSPFDLPREARGRHPRFCSGECRHARKLAQAARYRQEQRYPRKPIRKLCAICEAPFDTTNLRTECCSVACGRQLRSRRASATRTSRSVANRARVCKHCGGGFVMHHPSGKALRGLSNEGQFCSRRCADASRRPPVPVDLFTSLETERNR